MDLSRLKICFLAGSLGQGGAERQLFYMLRALRENGAAPRLLCLGSREFWEAKIKDLGVPITCVGHAQSKLRRLFRILAELRRDPPDVFQSQHFYTAAYVGVVGRLLRLASIGALRSNGLEDLRDSGHLLGWLCLHSPLLLAANSRTALNYAMHRGVPAERLYFLPNVVDTERFRPGPRQSGSTVRLIAVGSLRHAKRFDRFLSALVRLGRESKSQIKGLIVGAGPLRKELEKQAGDLGLMPSVVEFLGSVSEMAPIYTESDILVLTSQHEGTPNVLLEAMASGLPVVATRVGGVAEIVRHGENGFLVDPGDEEGLCAAVRRLVDDPQLKFGMGRNGRQYVEANHAVEGLPPMLAHLYRLALS
jgi:glycosyltransferase involved in cell wall biosynthesis